SPSSTKISSIIPEICGLISTSSSGITFPVASTLLVMVSSLATAVSKVTAGLLLVFNTLATAYKTKSTPIAINTYLKIFFMVVVIYSSLNASIGFILTALLAGINPINILRPIINTNEITI